MQHVIPIDLNGDGRLDLLMNLWCASQAGQPNNGPVVNSVVALIQTGPLIFEDQTREIFGTESVNLGGVGIRYVKYDFNGDGLDDIVFAVNMEDHRLGSNTLVQNTALMSSGKGRYILERIGSPAFSQGLTLKDNDVGTKDVVLMPANEALRYENGWNIVERFDWIGWVETLFTPRSAPGRGSTLAFAQGTASTDYFVYGSNEGRWQLVGEETMSGRYVPFKSYTGDVGQTKLFSIDGRDYAIGGFLESRLFRKTRSGAYDMLTILVGKEIVGGYQGGMLDENAGYPDMTQMVLLGIDEKGVFGRLPLTVIDEVKGISPHRMITGDLDGDGFDDAIIYRWRKDERPLIYLNDGFGNLRRVADRHIPSLSVNGNGHAGQLYADLDGDGIPDLLYYPIAGAWSDFSSVRLQVFKGLRSLRTSDLISPPADF